MMYKVLYKSIFPSKMWPPAMQRHGRAARGAFSPRGLRRHEERGQRWRSFRTPEVPSPSPGGIGRNISSSRCCGRKARAQVLLLSFQRQLSRLCLLALALNSGPSQPSRDSQHTLISKSKYVKNDPHPGARETLRLGPSHCRSFEAGQEGTCDGRFRLSVCL